MQALTDNSFWGKKTSLSSTYLNYDNILLYSLTFHGFFFLQNDVIIKHYCQLLLHPYYLQISVDLEKHTKIGELNIKHK